MAGYGTDRGPMCAPAPLTTMEAMTQSPRITTRPLAVPPAGRYLIDPEYSAVTFTTKHLFGLAPVRGAFALRDGTIDVAEPASASTVRARVAAPAFRTGNPVRDAAALSPRLLDAEAHPSLTFTSTGLSRGDGQPGEDPGWLLHGDLEVRGVTRPAQARLTGVSVAEGGGALRASARFSVDRYAFGITAYRGLAARWLTVDLDIRAERARS